MSIKCTLSSSGSRLYHFILIVAKLINPMHSDAVVLPHSQVTVVFVNMVMAFSDEEILIKTLIYLFAERLMID